MNAERPRLLDPAWDTSSKLLEPPPTVEELCLEAWGAGYTARDGEVSSLQLKLAQAEADADRYYRAAFDTPALLRERMDEDAEEYWTAFLAHDGEVPE